MPRALRKGGKRIMEERSDILPSAQEEYDLCSNQKLGKGQGKLWIWTNSFHVEPGYEWHQITGLQRWNQIQV